MSGAADQRSRLAARLAPRLASVRAAALFRRPRIADGPAGVERVVDGHRCLVFCSNDYLGLAGDPDVSAAFRRGVDRWGAGAGSAHLVGGHSRAHHELEEALAEFVDRPRALLFSTGYMANLGIGVALAARGDLVLEDRLNHASLLDAGLVSGARFARFAHGDPAALAERLERRAENRLVMTDGVFSMDGDVAPLPAYAAACARAGADLAVDDAHGLGVLGPGGRGTLAHFGLGVPEVPVLMGTLGKAFGTAGAFVAGETELIEWLIQRARTYVYTTAMPPALAEATRTALTLVERGDARRERLRERVARFRRGAGQLGFEPMASETPIQPLLVGDAGRASRISEHLLADGFLVTAIRPPTVPEGTARLRVTLSASHTAGQVDRLLEALGRAFKREGIEAQ